MNFDSSKQFEKYKKIGNFKLSSGRTSSYYYDIKEAMGEPENLREIIRELDKEHNFKDIDVIVGIEYGGVPIAVGLSLYTSIPFAVIRNSEKQHGTQKRIEGYQKVGRVLLLDDVKTSGRSIKDAKVYLKSKGYTITATSTVIIR